MVREPILLNFNIFEILSKFRADIDVIFGGLIFTGNFDGFPKSFKRPLLDIHPPGLFPRKHVLESSIRLVQVACNEAQAMAVL
jgi:hypothetical protein